MEAVALSEIRGQCHCGAVEFAVKLNLNAPLQVEVCNCSICEMSGNDHIIVPSRNFVLLKGAESLSKYQFNTHVAVHLFCKVCGVKSFYRPRSNPDGYAVTLRCLQGWEMFDVEWDTFDGQNWEQHADRLAHLSQ